MSFQAQIGKHSHFVGAADTTSICSWYNLHLPSDMTSSLSDVLSRRSCSTQLPGQGQL